MAVTVDEGFNHLAREIQLLRSDEFSNIVLCMGTFHMIKILLGCIGKYLRGSGAESIWIESSVFGVNVIESVLTGKKLAWSLKGMTLLSESMSRLEWCAFFKEHETESYQKPLELLQNLKVSVAAKNHEESQQIL